MSEPTTAKRPSQNALYTRALARLRDAHRDEFNTLLVGVYEESGLTYKRRRTKEERDAERESEAKQKAQAKIADLVFRYGPDVIPERSATVA